MAEGSKPAEGESAAKTTATENALAIVTVATPPIGKVGSSQVRTLTRNFHLQHRARLPCSIYSRGCIADCESEKLY